MSQTFISSTSPYFSSISVNTSCRSTTRRGAVTRLTHLRALSPTGECEFLPDTRGDEFLPDARGDESARRPVPPPHLEKFIVVLLHLDVAHGTCRQQKPCWLERAALVRTSPCQRHTLGYLETPTRLPERRGDCHSAPSRPWVWRGFTVPPNQHRRPPFSESVRKKLTLKNLFNENFLPL